MDHDHYSQPLTTDGQGITTAYLPLDAADVLDPKLESGPGAVFVERVTRICA